MDRKKKQDLPLGENLNITVEVNGGVDNVVPEEVWNVEQHCQGS